jgi:hypothetical protein
LITMNTYINTTPHSITETTSGITFPKDPNCQLRINVTSRLINTTSEGIPLYAKSYGQLENEPPVLENTYYITSLLVKQAYSHRVDFITPGELLRDASGQPIGCEGFAL